MTQENWTGTVGGDKNLDLGSGGRGWYFKIPKEMDKNSTPQDELKMQSKRYLCQQSTDEGVIKLGTEW